MAFVELQAVSGLHLDAEREIGRRALVEALERATDRLGPLPGGRLATIRPPDGGPAIVEGVAPTLADLIEIARAAGTACGYLHTATDGDVDIFATIDTIARAKGS
jgi:hypothetical protein